MFGERIVSEGLAHYSYLIGDQNEALVIDPRIDCQIYIEKADKEECVIKNVLETHRNEDYLIGSVELRKRTDADIWHADDQLGIEYGEAVEEGQKWRIGRFKLEAIHTPGHTPGSMSYLLYGTDGEPWILFTGDLLFAGDNGRVDLLGMDKAEEMASMIYDSLFHKILRLGDEIIVCPAHGSGSVCGSKISERTWTTIGLEKKLNPKLQFEDKSSFIENVVEKLERPPYFREMEKGNKEGRFLPKNFPFAKPLKPEKFEKKIPEAQVIDTRMETSYGSAHIPDSLSIWKNGLPSFAGWFLTNDKPVITVNNAGDMEEVSRKLVRIGFNEVEGYLAGGMLKWHMAGKKSDSINT